MAALGLVNLFLGMELGVTSKCHGCVSTLIACAVSNMAHHSQGGRSRVPGATPTIPVTSQISKPGNSHVTQGGAQMQTAPGVTSEV